MSNENELMPAVAAAVAEWRDPAVDAPPRGAKLLLLTSGGVAALGPWSDGSNYIAWSPLPKRPAWATAKTLRDGS